MWSPTTQFGKKVSIMMLIFFFVSLLVPVDANLSNKLDETSMPQAPNLGMKCTTCSCANPCDPQHPLPPPPPSSQYCNPTAPPPPPRFVYFTSPLPLAVPPPPERFVYFSDSPPGNSYGTDPSDLDIFVGGTRSDVVSLRDLVGFALLQIFTFWLL